MTEVVQSQSTTCKKNTGHRIWFTIKLPDRCFLGLVWSSQDCRTTEEPYLKRKQNNWKMWVVNSLFLCGKRVVAASLLLSLEKVPTVCLFLLQRCTVQTTQPHANQCFLSLYPFSSSFQLWISNIKTKFYILNKLWHLHETIHKQTPDRRFSEQKYTRSKQPSWKVPWINNLT